RLRPDHRAVPNGDRRDRLAGLSLHRKLRRNLPALGRCPWRLVHALGLGAMGLLAGFVPGVDRHEWIELEPDPDRLWRLGQGPPDGRQLESANGDRWAGRAETGVQRVGHADGLAG